MRNSQHLLSVGPSLPAQVFDLESQVRPAVRSLKAANIDVTDIWFVITKHLEILTEPIALQRWLDFLSLQVRSAQPQRTGRRTCVVSMQCRQLLESHQPTEY